MKTTAIAVALALAVTTLGALGQDAGGPPPPPPAGEGPAGGGPGMRGGGQGGFHLLPPHVVEQLNLTEDQQKQVTDLETEVKAKLEKILTAEQQEQFKQMRPPPPRGMGGMGGGPGAGGPGGGRTGAGKGGGGKGTGGKDGGQTPPPPAE